jgi:hypothetical protein
MHREGALQLRFYNYKGRAAVRRDDRYLGHCRHAGRRHHRRPAGLAGTERRLPGCISASASAAHQRGDLCVRRLRAVRHVLLRRAAHLPHRSVFRRPLAAFTFWGWQLVIVLAAITLPLGFTQGKEYAELEWPIDILITLVWVSYAVVFFGTIAKRKVTHIYVANWFYGGFILAVALLHIVNSAAIPVSLLTTKSYSAYAGVQDAMIQWWYGHNAVGFFLTAGFLGMMYYFVPKQAGARCIPTACRWCTSGR